MRTMIIDHKTLQTGDVIEAFVIRMGGNTFVAHLDEKYKIAAITATVLAIRTIKIDKTYWDIIETLEAGILWLDRCTIKGNSYFQIELLSP